MTTDPTPPAPPASGPGEAEPPARRPLPGAAERALAEAAARRAERARRREGEASREINGRGGLDPTRYGDWEVNGLTSDF